VPRWTRATVAILLLGAACGSSRKEGRLTVVASFYPLYEASSRIAGRAATVVNLTPAGAEPHDLELTSAQLDLILDADVVVYEGGGFQPAVEDAVAKSSAAKLDVLPRDAKDPHIWLDPMRMSAAAGAVQRALSLARPSEAAGFRERERAYSAELATLDRQLRDGLAHCARTDVVTSHAAFGHFAARYGLEQHPISGIAPDVEPDPAKLAELADFVRSHGVTTIFTETLVSPKVAQTLAREARVTTAVLDPLEGLTSDEIKAGASYASVTRENLAELRKALDCQ
jgi:zinc transport system substrate-binding protein